MHQCVFWILANIIAVWSKQISKTEKLQNQDLKTSQGTTYYYKYIKPIGAFNEDVKEDIPSRVYEGKDVFSPENPLVSALLLSTKLHQRPRNLSANHPSLPPINPFLALLLSQYGRYIPLYGPGKGIYAYQAANDFHNNKPFGAYKVYEDNE